VRVEVLNSTAVSVHWQVPTEKEQNGVIHGYQIHYVKVGENDEPYGGQGMYDTADGKITDTTIASLMPDTFYRFQVAAYTRKGDGERSRPKKVKTKGAGQQTGCFVIVYFSLVTYLYTWFNWYPSADSREQTLPMVLPGQSYKLI